MDEHSEGTVNAPTEDAELSPLLSLGQQLVEQIFDNAPLSALKSLVDSGAPLWFQDSEGVSALHAAAYSEREEVVNWLLEAGAVWNAGGLVLSLYSGRRAHLFNTNVVDALGYTAGDIALSFNNASIYRTIRDAGLRSGEPFELNGYHAIMVDI